MQAGPIARFTCLLLAVAPLLFGLTGCGQKGPLYLPQDNVAATNNEQAQTTTADKPPAAAN